MPISDIVFFGHNKPEEVVNSEDPYSYGKWFKAKNIDIIPLSMLGYLLKVAPYQELMKGFQPIHPPEGESFILSFPSGLQDKVMSLTNFEITEVVEKWAKIEEFSGMTSNKSLEEYLVNLKEFLKSEQGYANLFMSM